LHAILGYLIADLGVRLLPARLADRAGVWLARVAFALRPPARRAVELNLGRLAPRLAPETRRGLALRAFEHFALSLTDFLRLGQRGRAALAGAVEVRGRRHLDAALATGRGVILLSAHLGNWEWGAAFVAESGARLSVVARPHPNRWVERFFRRRRGEAGVVTLEGRPVWARAASALRRGEWVALLGDRAPAAAGGSGASVCAWSSALARRTGALVLPAVMVRVAPRRYAACFGAPLTPQQCAAGGYRSAMHRFLKRYPGQWCAFEALPAGWAR
jgi:Kdo2-lipid IVA lauroyltransferase/acyltransferase